eukprot:1161190-Pelagomonas_calceolata.AAC.13
MPPQRAAAVGLPPVPASPVPHARDQSPHACSACPACPARANPSAAWHQTWECNAQEGMRQRLAGVHALNMYRTYL